MGNITAKMETADTRVTHCYGVLDPTMPGRATWRPTRHPRQRELRAATAGLRYLAAERARRLFCQHLGTAKGSLNDANDA